MKIKWKQLLICIAIPLLSGALVGLITKNAMPDFAALNQPPLSPPGWLFPLVWSALYVLMGIASYLIISSLASPQIIRRAIKIYGVQLAFNFAWPILFFALNLHYLSFIWLVALWVLILVAFALFWRIHKPAAYILLPYLLWTSFAGYLNLAIALLN